MLLAVGNLLYMYFWTSLSDFCDLIKLSLSSESKTVVKIAKNCVFPLFL